MIIGSMQIPWKDNEAQFVTMEEAFLQIGKDALTMNHYDLAAVTTFSPTQWKNFIIHPKVKKYIDTEFQAIERSELRKSISGINKSRSVGQAQVITALARRAEGKEDQREGPAFVYCYIPLNAEQAHAENVVKLDFDPFLVDKDNKERKVAELVGTVFRDYVKSPDQMTPLIIDTVEFILAENYNKKDEDNANT